MATDLNQQLFEACKIGDFSLASSLLISSIQVNAESVAIADAHYQDPETGTSCLMNAALYGHKEIVELLLEHGAPWNALDRNGKCAGEYAIDGNHQEIIDILVSAGVRAEMILGTIENRIIEKYKLDQLTEDNSSHGIVNAELSKDDEYLNHGIKYKNDNLLDEKTDQAVMMTWEKPLMDIHAKIICSRIDIDDSEEADQNDVQLREINVLNVGFGLGLIDSALQRINDSYKNANGGLDVIVNHCIIEAHPDVIKELTSKGWDRKSNVKILQGKWQDVLAGNSIENIIDQHLNGNKFDGIFFDTYGEYYRDMQQFHKLLPRILNPNGIYSYFNGLCPRNVFFHGVYCEIVKLELSYLNFEVLFHPISIEDLNKRANEENQNDDVRSDDTWNGVKDKYWFSDEYFLPICIYKPDGAESHMEKE